MWRLTYQLNRLVDGEFEVLSRTSLPPSTQKQISVAVFDVNMDDTALTAFSFNALLYLFIFLSFFTGLLHAQSGGGAARLKLNRNVTASSNPPSNIQQTFTWPNKSKCLVVLYLISSYFLEPVCSVPRRHGPGFECRRRQQVFFSPKRTEPF